MNKRLGEHLIFIASQPRSGSTLLQRILAAHPKIHTTAEPWLMLHPLYGLKKEGHSADYDAGLAYDGLEDFLETLPQKEKTYLRALRRFGNTLYQEALKGTGKTFFLDKTPRYYFILPDLRKVFPKAKFIVLLRNPLAVLASVLNTWVRGNWNVLTHYTSDLLYAPQYLVQALEKFGEEVLCLHYEELVMEPEQVIGNLCEHFGIAFNPNMLEYGNYARPSGRMGDPVGIYRYSRPVSSRVEAWKEELNAPAKFLADAYLDYLGSDIITRLGYSFTELSAQLESVPKSTTSLDLSVCQQIVTRLGLPEKYVTFVKDPEKDSTVVKNTTKIISTKEPEYLVSAIVSTYNAEKLIRGCLEDLERQTIADKIEIIVIDSCSPQNEGAIVREFQQRYDNIVYLRTEEREPLYTTWNRGVRAARGKYITNANTDDRHWPMAFQKQVEVLETRPDIALAYYDSAITQVVDVTPEEAPIIACFRWPDFNTKLLFRGNYIGPHPMWRKEMHAKYGFFDEKMIVAGDYEFWLRMAIHEQFYHIPEVLGLYFESPQSIEHANQDIGQKEVATLLKRYWPTNFGPLPPFDSNFVVPVEQVRSRGQSIHGKTSLPTGNAKPKFKVTAIIAAYNEGDIIYHVIRDLVEQGIFVYLIDHHSTDNTVEEASKWLNRGLIGIETFPEDSGFDLPNDVYSWRYILRRKEDIVKAMGPGWYLHADADEFRESPWFGLTLKEAIEYVDSKNYNAIEFKIFDFKPTDNSYKPGDDVREKLKYYSPPFHEWDNIQVKCWKYYGQDFVLWKTGGHVVEFEDKRVFPIPFIMRHYPIRSQEHGLKKIFTERKNRFDPDERSIEWHAQYDYIKDSSFNFIKDKAELVLYDESQVKETLLTTQFEPEINSQPLVSIIIPVFNQLELTHQCLKSIIKNTSYRNFEIIVVDNGSTDGTPDYLKKMETKGVRSLIHSKNLGFVGGCNSGANIARGEFVLFLNNDTEVQPGWLTSLVMLTQQKSDCGAVGSKLVYPNGKLQEAGGIIFSDGNGWNYGRNLDPDDPRFNYVRIVDYCSGACLMINKNLWDRLGGFDERYSPAYYEDTDICFGLRKLGYQVYYQPHSVVIHHEGQTAGTELASGFKKYQELNRKKFIAKWSTELHDQFSNDPQNIPQAHSRNIQKRILYVDPFVPEYDKASGSLRLYQILKLLKQIGFHVTFIARSSLPKTSYQLELEQLGIEVYTPDVKALEVLGNNLKGEAPIPYEILFKERQFDYAILSFWGIAEYYLPLVKKFSPHTKIIIDTVDIHFIRELREAELKNDPNMLKKALANKKREIAVYNKAARLWVVTANDRKAIKDSVGNIPIEIVPNIHKKVREIKSYADTHDLLFVGNFNHRPNRDAVTYFVEKIFPLILNDLPDVKLFIVGNNPPENIKSLSSGNIIVTGYVKDLSPYLRMARVSVNPLRYGAGMKGKIGEALSWGLPVVTTSIGAEGMGLKNGEHALIADDPQTFAKQTVRLYVDRNTWDELSKKGRELVRKNWSPEAIRQIIETLLTDKSERPLVSIIILTYNALQYTKQCVDSVQRYTNHPHEIIFIDNNSTDGTVSYLRKLVRQNPNYRLLENDSNVGFAAGNNQGMKVAKGDYLLLLNNDVLVSPRWLEKMVACAEMDPSIGLVGPLSNNVSGFQKVENIKYEDSEDYLDAASKVARINHRRYTPRRRIAGFAMLIKGAVYDKIGGLDEQFGSGNYEDDDYCLRAKKAGYKIMVAEEVFLHHFGSQSFKYNKINYKNAIVRNRHLFEKKWPKIDPKWLLEISGRLVDENADLLKQGRKALEEEKIRTAVKCYEQVLETDPLQSEAWYGLGLAHQLNGQYQEALRRFQRVAEIVPQFPDVYFNLGLLHNNLGDKDTALVNFQKCLELDSTNHHARRNFAELLIDLGHYHEGIQMLQSILDENPKDVDSLAQMGMLFLETGQETKARDYFEKVLSLDPQHELVRNFKENTLPSLNPGSG